MTKHNMPDWKCVTCGQLSILGGNVDRRVVIAIRRRIEQHMKTHRMQLEEHGGDVDDLKLRLQNPARYRAIKLHPPIVRPPKEPEPAVEEKKFPNGLDYDPDEIPTYTKPNNEASAA